MLRDDVLLVYGVALAWPKAWPVHAEAKPAMQLQSIYQHLEAIRRSEITWAAKG